MAFMTPEVNGARQELPCLESPEINGARQEVAVVEKYVDGVWQEVWSAGYKLTVFEETNIVSGVYHNITDGFVTLQAVEHTGDIICYLTVVVEGDFINPTLNFDYYGGCSYLYNNNIKYTGSGKISTVTRAVGSESLNYNIITTVDGDTSIGTQTDLEEGSYSITLNGSYDLIGIQLQLNGFSNTQLTIIDHVIQVGNIYIDGKQCK